MHGVNSVITCFIGMMKNSEFLSSHSLSCFLEIEFRDSWRMAKFSVMYFIGPLHPFSVHTLSLSILFYGEEMKNSYNV